MRPFVYSQAFILQEHGPSFSVVLVKPKNAAVEGKHVDVSLWDRLSLAIEVQRVGPSEFGPVGNALRRRGPQAVARADRLACPVLE